MRGWVSRGAALGLALLAGIAAPATLFAQQCPLCYTSAAASSAKFIQALKGGILALLIPSVFIGAVFSVIAYRRRDECGQTEARQPPAGQPPDFLG